MADAKIVLTAEDRTKAAFASAKAGLTGVSDLAAKAGFSLAALGGAVTISGLSALVKNIADGIDAMNDLKDATGASIENISALESIARRAGGNFETVSATLLKFNQALGLTLRPGSDAEKVIKAIGLNAKELRDLDPAEALLKTASALNTFADDGKKGVAVQLLFGRSLKEMAPLLKDVAEAGQLVATVTTQQAEEAEKFNKEMFKLNATLLDFGRTIANPVIEHMNQLIDRFRDGQKEGDGFLVTLGKLMGKIPVAPFAAMGLAADLFGGSGNGYTDAREGIEAINFHLARTNITEQQRNGLLAQRLVLEKQLAGYLNSSAGAGRGSGYGDLPKGSLYLPPDDDKKAAAAVAKELEEQAKLLAELSGLTGSFAEDWNRLNVLFAKGTLNLQQLEKAQADLLAKQPAVKKNLDEEKEAREALIKVNKAWYAAQLESQEEAAAAYVAEDLARQAARASVSAYAQGVGEVHEQLELELSLVGATEAARKRALALYRIELDLKQQIAAIEDFNSGFDAAQREEEKAKARAAAAQARANVELQAELDVAAKVQQEWERTNEQIADSFVDNLMRGGKNIAQYLKDLFRTLVLRPILSPIGQAGAAAIGSFGVAGSMQGGSGMLGSIGSSMLGSSIMGGLGAFGTGASYGAASLFANGLGGTLAAGSQMIGAGSVMAGIGTIAGALGPIALGVAALMSFVKDRGGPKAEGQVGPFDLGVGRGGGELNPAASQMAQGLQAQYDAIVRAAGGRGGVQFGVGLSSDPKGTAPTFVQVAAGRGGQQFAESVNLNVGRDEASMAAALQAQGKEVLLAALRASDLPALFAGLIDSDLDKSIERITVASQMQQQVNILSLPPLERIAALRQQELEAIDPLLRGLAEELRAKQEQATLEERLFDLTATEAEKLTRARELEMAAATETGRVLLQQIYAREDEIAAMERLQDVAEDVIETVEDLGVALQRRLDDAVGAWLQGSELLAYRADQVRRRMLEVGIDYSAERILQTTRTEIRELFEYLVSIGDLDAANAMLDVSDALLEITAPAEEAAQALRNTAQALQNAGKGVSDFIRELVATRAGTATPQASLAGLRGNYLADLSLARASNLDATQRISQSAQAYIEAQKGYSGSGATTQAVISQVISELQSLPAVKSYEQQSLEALAGVLDALRTLPADISAQLAPTIAEKFSQIDLNGDGITFDEMQAALLGKATDAQLRSIFALLDTDGDGTISRLEALAGQAASGNLTSQQILNRLNQDSILSYGRADVAWAYTSLVENTAAARDWLQNIYRAMAGSSAAAVSAVPAMAPTTGPSTPVPVRLVDYTTDPLVSDVDKLRAELAAYNTAKASGMPASAYAASLGYSPETLAAWLAKNNLPGFDAAPTASRPGTAALVRPVSAAAGATIEEVTKASALAVQNAVQASVQSASRGALASVVQATTAAASGLGLSAAQQAYYDAILGQPGQGTQGEILQYVTGLQDRQALASLETFKLGRGRTAALPSWIHSSEPGAFEAWAKDNFPAALPAFAVGTNRVPQDMLAMVHKDEAIVPARYNPAVGGGDNREVVRELQLLRQDNKQLLARLIALEAQAADRSIAAQEETSQKIGQLAADARLKRVAA